MKEAYGENKIVVCANFYVVKNEVEGSLYGKLKIKVKEKRSTSKTAVIETVSFKVKPSLTQYPSR